MSDASYPSTFYVRSRGGEVIDSVDDWLIKAPPAAKDKHWKDLRSAKELAKAFFRQQTVAVPDELVTLLESRPETRGFSFTHGIAEEQLTLDKFRGGTRNTDLGMYGQRGADKLFVGVEAKADEPFDTRTIREALEKGEPDGSNLDRRVKQLCRGVFGHEKMREVGYLKYQLLHGIAAVAIRAKAVGASVGVFLVYEFISSGLNDVKMAQNKMDLQDFVNSMTRLNKEKVNTNALLPPVHLYKCLMIPKDVPVVIGKLRHQL